MLSGVSVVEDGRSGDLILKMVNLLPLEIHARINLKDINNIASSAVKTILTGNPDDKNARPVSGAISVGNEFDFTLPRYSFSLVRIKML